MTLIIIVYIIVIIIAAPVFFEFGSLGMHRFPSVPSNPTHNVMFQCRGSQINSIRPDVL